MSKPAPVQANTYRTPPVIQRRGGGISRRIDLPSFTHQLRHRRDFLRDITMQTPSTNKLELLMKVPAIANAIRDFETVENDAALNRRLAAIAAFDAAADGLSEARKAEGRAAAELDRVRDLLNNAWQQHAAAQAQAAFATRQLNEAMKALGATGESELLTGIRRLEAWISRLEVELNSLEASKLKPGFGSSQVSFDEIANKATRLACLKSDLPMAKQKLSDLLALRGAPISPDELRLAVRAALQSAALPDDAEKQNEEGVQRALKSHLHMGQGLLS